MKNLLSEEEQFRWFSSRDPNPGEKNRILYKDKHFKFPDWVRDGEVKKTSSLKIKAAKEYVKRSDNDFDKYLVLTSKDLFDDKSFKIFNLERLKKALLQENE